MHRIWPIALLALLTACGDDELPAPQPDATSDAVADVDATPDVATDVEADVEPDVVPDVPAPPSTVTLRLVNQNPGGLSRWVQVVDNRGTPGWYNMMPAGAMDEFLRVHDACTICNCDEPDCDECTPEPEILELAPGESVTAVWDGSVVEFDQDGFCETPGETEETAFQVEFVWSPEPPDETGALPIGTLSRTRLQFELGTDDAVVYEIEVLAEE